MCSGLRLMLHQWLKWKIGVEEPWTWGWSPVCGSGPTAVVTGPHVQSLLCPNQYSSSDLVEWRLKCKKRCYNLADSVSLAFTLPFPCVIENFRWRNVRLEPFSVGEQTKVNAMCHPHLCSSHIAPDDDRCSMLMHNG